MCLTYGQALAKIAPFCSSYFGLHKEETIMGAILNREMAKKAVRIAGMTFTGMFQENFLTRNALHVVVLDPTKHFDPNGFYRAILYEESFGKSRAGKPAFRGTQGWIRILPNSVFRTFMTKEISSLAEG